MKVLLISEGAHEQSGALETLCSRLLERPLECEHRSAIHDQPRRLLQGKGGKFKKKALAWLSDAREDGYDAVVYLIDFDKGNDDRIAQFDEAQTVSISGFDLPRAFGVAVRSFDAWMLADETALSTALGRTVSCQSLPEDNRDPKTTAREIAAKQLALRDLYTKVAESARLDTLCERCPKGFAPFAARIRGWPVTK